MKKVGRNDPCPCGSGKKFKKCHGASNVIELTPAPYNFELDELHSELVRFAGEEHREKVMEVFEDYSELGLHEDEERSDMFLSSLMQWMIFEIPIEGDLTIFDLYFNKQKNKIKHERVRQVFATWKYTSPSVYQVISATEEETSIQDIWTEEEYNIPREAGEYSEGILLIGFLLPYVGHHEFFLQTLEVENPNPSFIDQIKAIGEISFIDDYPEILARLLSDGETPNGKMEWDHPMYAAVASLLIQHMTEKNAHESLAAAGAIIWKRYTEEVMPDVRKPGAYAAAVEYVVQQHAPGNLLNQSQAHLAKEYGTSSATVSKHKRAIEEVLGEEIDDIFDTMADAREELDTKTENPEYIMPPELSARLAASDKLLEALQTEGDLRRQLIKQALNIYPNQPDAYLLLAEMTDSLQEKYQLACQAVKAGEKDLGKDFFQENKGDFWVMTETRPYMRAKAELAFTQYHLGDKPAAIKTYEDILELNPNDNQGVRYTLLLLYLEEKQLTKAEEILQEHEESADAAILFNKALLYFFRKGLTNETKAILKEADEQNPYVKMFLTGEKRLPAESPEYIGLGDENEAVSYVQESFRVWKDADLLIEELKKW